MLKTTLQTKTVGTLLIEKRKEKDLEVKDVSLALKIRSEYLLALEEGRYNVFRSEVYLIGFLKNYSKFLGIDTEKILAMYRRENERKYLGEDSLITKPLNKKLNLILTPNKIVTILAGLAVVLVLVYLGSYVGKVLKKPTISLSSPVVMEQEGETIYKTDAAFIELAGLAEIGSKLTINDQELKLNSFEKFSKEFNLEKGINTFVIKGENQFGRSSIITLVVTKEESAVTVTPTQIPLIMSVSMEIIKKDTNIIVLVDGEKKTDRIYKVGSLLEFTAFKSFELKATNVTSVNFKLNGVTETINQDTVWEIINGEIVKK
jgi:transcriptional regulator with XRE-family HTH domain